MGYSFVKLTGGYVKKRGQALDLSQRSNILNALTKAYSCRFHFIHVEMWVFKHRESFSQPCKAALLSEALSRLTIIITSYGSSHNVRDAIAERSSE